MALSRLFSKANGQATDVTDITADLDQIYGSSLSLVSPLTGDLAVGGFDITGIDELALNDTAANASATGRARRNGAALTYHDGTAARRVLFTATSDLTTNGVMYATGVGIVNSLAAMTNGQLIIGSTGAGPSLAALTGTANQVVVTNGAGTVTLSTPQSIGTGSSPTFTNLTLSGLTVNSFAYSGAAGLLTTTSAPTNGQILIGSTGAAPVAATLTQGANVTITNGAGTITIAASAGVALGDSPTWTGTHTFSLDGRPIILSGATNILAFLNSGDSGWGNWGVASFGRGVVGTNSATGALHFGYNFYNDDSNYRYTGTDGSTRLQCGTELAIKTAASGTAGNAITYTDEVLIGPTGTIHGAPTGGQKGAGTINAIAVYDDNTLLTDHVFESERTGTVSPHPDLEIQRWQQRFNPAWLNPGAFQAKCLADGQLPEMPTFRGEKSTGQILNALTMAVELGVIHDRKLAQAIQAIETRLQALEAP